MKNIFRFYVVSLVLILFGQLAQANVLGNLQTFAPNPDSLIFQNIHSTRTLGKNYFNVGIFGAFVRNELSTYDDLITPEYYHYKDEAFTYDLIFAWGMTDNLEFIFNAPGYIDQKPDSDQTRQYTISRGMNGYRPGLKYSLPRGYLGSFAVVGSVDITQAQENPYVGNSPSPIYNFELVWDRVNANHGFGVNVGYRKRTPGTTATNDYFFPIRDQLIASAGYVYGPVKRTRYHAELFSSMAMDKGPHPEYKNVSSLEALLGIKHRLAKGLWGHLGATLEIMPEGLAPDYRVYTGLNYFFGGWKSESADEVKETPVAREVQRPLLRVTPEEVDLEPMASQKFEVEGGQPPYSYYRSEQVGYWDELDTTYTAPDMPVDLSLLVRDSLGEEVSVPIHVQPTFNDAARPQLSTKPLTVNPGHIVVYTGGSEKFVISGGLPGYQARLATPFGSIGRNPWIYQAPMKPGKVVMTVEDEGGSLITVPIEVIPIPKAGKTLTIHNLKFVFAKDILIPESEKTLKKNLDQIKVVDVVRIIVAGHTDSKGSDAYNQNLSRQRAEAVAVRLRKQLKLSESQVQAVGYGESAPIATNNTDAGRQLNRRVELKLYYKK